MNSEGNQFKLSLIIIISILFLFTTSISSAFLLPDTGQTTCYSVNGKAKEIMCPPPGDTTAQDGSYTIYPPSYIDNGGGTVTDNNTFLIWQQGTENFVATWEYANTYCSNLTFAGHSDWRLPSKSELASIIDYGKYNPAIDNSVFTQNVSGYYWTYTEDTSSAWMIDFNNGSLKIQNKSASGYIKCVRGLMKFDNLIYHADSTFNDPSTGLMWQNSNGPGMKWSYALKYCEELSFAGYTDWRLPNAREFMSLSGNSSNVYGSGYNYWTSTTQAADTNNVWVTSLPSLVAIPNPKSYRDNYVKCVRGEKDLPIDYQEIYVNPNGLEFGYTSINNPRSFVLTVTNIGGDMLAVENLDTPSAPFSITADGCSGKVLQGCDFCEITVRFAPVFSGTYIDSITLTSNDADNQYITLNLTGIGFNPLTKFILPDTGQTSCYNELESVIFCPGPENPLAQDGSYIINSPSFSVDSYDTATDNNTELMWQRAEDGITRTWYEAAEYCNDLTLGGYDDWRMPTEKELFGIVDFGRYAPSINTSIFPNTKIDRYWSFSSNKFNNDYAWNIYFGQYTTRDCCAGGYCGEWNNYDGVSVYSTDKFLDRNYVRCVRGEVLPLGIFVDNGDNTVTDSATGLIWQQGSSALLTWTNALAYCENLTLGGYSDWRLSNAKELESLLIESSSSLLFSGASGYNYWSSTSLGVFECGLFWGDTYAYAGSQAGWFGKKSKSSASYAKCVRGPDSQLQPSTIEGTVNDLFNGLPLSNVAVSVIDAEKTQSTVTDTAGTYSVSNITAGTFIATFSKSGYITQTINGTLSSGETKTLNAQLSPIPPLTISITSPQDGATINSTPITVTGNVTNNADVSVNGIIASRSGNIFTASVPLVEGPNTITAMATDQYGQTASDSLTVTYIDPIPPVISNITITNITTDSAVITWTTDQLSDSLVEYGETTAYGNTASDAGLVTAHSISLNNLSPDKTYHFKITSMNADNLYSSSEDQIFATLKFMATTIGDYSNVTVMEVTGNYDVKNPDDTINYIPRQEIAKEYYKNHPDTYDFFMIFTNFDFTFPQPDATGSYLEVKNDVQGIGRQILDESSQYGSNSKLQGMIDMGNFLTLASDPSDPNFEVVINTLAHEHMHRWGSSVRFIDSNSNISSDLIGKDGVHWSYMLDTDGSLMYGNDWKDNGDGTFISVSASRYYSPLDLYLMGIYDSTQVPQMLLIDNQSIDKTKLPEIGKTITGTANFVTIDDIISAEGARIPDAVNSQKSFKTAFIFITSPGTFTGNEINGIENIRNAWAGKFASLTNGKATIADVTPSITISMSSPSNNETISKPFVTVKGALINNTGKETGVTVNGTPATVYGNQFIVNSLPLIEGQNSITITATDTAGNTSRSSIDVNAVTTGNYIRLVSNIESGIAPLEVSLRIDGSFSIEESNLNIIGPTQPEVISSTPDEYQLKFNTEGIYNLTASSTGPDSIVYEDAITLIISNKDQLDTLLRGKWTALTDSLMIKDTTTALSYISSFTKQKYEEIYNEILDQLPAITATQQELRYLYTTDIFTKYKLITFEDNEYYAYEVTFIKDLEGIWRILQY